MLGKAISLFGLFYLLFEYYQRSCTRAGSIPIFGIRCFIGKKAVFFSILTMVKPDSGRRRLYSPLCAWEKILEPTMLFPQSDSMDWPFRAAFISCLCLLFIRLLDRRVQPAVALSVLLNERFGGILKAFCRLPAYLPLCYPCNLTVKWLFGTNISLFCTNFSTFNPRKALVACSYFPVFMIYFFCTGMFQIKYLYF